jgi:fatty-acyl-CoA synthase
VGIADERWQERPLAFVVVRPGAPTPAVADLRESLRGRVPSWWTPESWAFVEQLPRTTVGKIDKGALRALAADGGTEIKRS